MGFQPVEPPRPPGSEDWPWEDPGPARAAVFACLDGTGADPAVDGLFRLRALRRGRDGLWETLERFCDPFPATDGEVATRRMVQEHGVSGADLEGAPPAEALAGELFEFLGAGPVIALDGEGTAAWLAHLAGGRSLPTVLGLDEGARLLLPGRDDLTPAAADGPRAVQRALAAMIGEWLALPEGVLELTVAGLAAGWKRLSESDPALADELAAWLSLAEHPGCWAEDPGELFGAHPALGAGRLGRAARFARDPDADPAGRAQDLAEVLEPRCAAVGRAWEGFDTVPVHASGELALEPEDLGRIDDVFQVHLPALAADARPFVYRRGQLDVAREVARTLGAGELLLVSAPTGTGKTLAYLVPAALWALRNEVRVGVSTYTRALQEQAAAREVPRALDALARAGLERRPRVSLLKGRGNYLCWRALRAQVPSEDDGAETWLAWTLVALFALRDDDGDLDQLPLRFPLRSRALARAQHGTSATRYQRELEVLVRAVRAQPACCARKQDRQTCAAEVARARAERSHVVLTNHAFALARQAFFKHIVLDECEHLHDQAHGAWSHALTPRELRELLGRLTQPGRSLSRAVLDRLARLVPAGTAGWQELRRCLEASGETAAALAALERALDGYKAWREEARRGRAERDEHALLREFVEHAEEIELAPPLLEARARLARAGSELDGRLADLATRLDAVPARGLPRLRRTLELARVDLLERLAALEAWIPLEEDRPALRLETFHDVESDLRGQDVLAARVLLPNEFLGRRYYPQLSSAVLISASTWLKGSFDSARGYLGLDRAAEPAPDEEREPRRVSTFRAPEVFDYGRVLVGVPRDAPDVREREAWLRFVRRFVAHLGERTRGRMLVLLTNTEDLRRTGEALAGFFRARRIPLWWQGMAGVAKEELPRLFRTRRDSVLLGVDTFWFGADFPGETLEYLVLARLPYGVPDRYHHAQCAALGSGEQRRRIYMPRALGKLRQGFGRLMRRESDRGCVFVLDRRVLEPRHRAFLRELPLAGAALGPDETWSDGGARLALGSTDEVVHAGLAHMGMLADVRRRGLEQEFAPATEARPAQRPMRSTPSDASRRRPAPRAPEAEPLDIPPEDVPF